MDEAAQDHLLEQVKDYLVRRDWSGIPDMQGRNFSVSPLAHGEYNSNYLLTDDETKLVFRVNISSQIEREDQILYEYRTLQMLRFSGVTPLPVFADDSREIMDHGISIMQYLPGRPLDYTRATDLFGAATTLARIHSTTVEGPGHLIVEQEPLNLIFRECSTLLEHYFASDLADPAIRRLLENILIQCDSLRAGDRFFSAVSEKCIVNTEVNSGNFIVNHEQQTIHLIDWEMPRWGDPSSDLCHFCSPLTTLWKSRYRMTDTNRDQFLEAYRQGLTNPHLAKNLDQQIHLKFPFVLLRGISWSAMAWVAYQTDFAGIRNEDTWQTLKRYLDYDFIRELFQPWLKQRLN